MTELTDLNLLLFFLSCVVVLTAVGLLVVVAVLDHRSAKRQREAIEARAALYGEERKRAADWIASHCFWIPEDKR